MTQKQTLITNSFVKLKFVHRRGIAFLKIGKKHWLFAFVFFWILWRFSNTVLYFSTFILFNYVKVLPYDKYSKMKRSTGPKNVFFSLKRTAFMSGISLHFQPFIDGYGFRFLKIYSGQPKLLHLLLWALKPVPVDTIKL